MYKRNKLHSMNFRGYTTGETGVVVPITTNIKMYVISTSRPSFFRKLLDIELEYRSDYQYITVPDKYIKYANAVIMGARWTDIVRKYIQNENTNIRK